MAERFYVLPLASLWEYLLAHSSRPDLQLFLDRLTSRSVLTEEERQAVLNLPTHAVQVQANRDFVLQGERVEHACLVVAGLVGRFCQNADGKRQITAIHIAGDMADLHSVVQPSGTSSLQALSTGTILRVPHNAIRAAAARYPALAEAFWRDCMVDAAILSEWVLNVGRRDARARIAHLLCEIATRMETVPGDDGDLAVGFAVTQAQFADATGLTAVHVNRILQSLRHEGIAEWRARSVHILDWDRLVTVGEFDPSYLQMHIPPEGRLRLARAS